MNIKSYSSVSVSNVDDGTIYYTWIKYADTPESGMSDNPEGKKYIGIAYNKDTNIESNDYSDYSWSLVVGNGVASIDVEYALSDSKTESPSEDSSLWGADPADWTTGLYLWKRTKIVYTDDAVQYTEPVYDAQYETVTSSISSVSSKVDKNHLEITNRVQKVETITVTDADGNLVTRSTTDIVVENLQNIEGVTTKVEVAQSTADSKNQTYRDAGNPNYNSSDSTTNVNSPSVSWTDEEKQLHIGDLYIDTNTGYTYRWNGTIWDHIQDKDITSLGNKLTLVEQTADKISWLVSSGSTESSITLTDSMLTAITKQFVVKSPDGSITLIEGGKITTNSITTDMLKAGCVTSDILNANAVTANKIAANAVTTDKIIASAITTEKIATDAIKSSNYNQGSSATFSTTGSFLDLENGSLYTPGFYVNGTSGEAYFKGTITAPAGTIGDWHIESGLYSKIYTEGLDAFSFENKDVPMEVGDGNVTYAEIIIVPDTYELYSSSSSVSYKSVIRSRIYPWVYSDGYGGVESGYEVTGYAKGFDIKSDGSFFFGNENLSDFSYIEYDRYKAMFNVGTYMFSCSAQDIRFDNIGEGFMYVNSSGITETKLSAVSDSGWIGVDIDSDSSSQFTPYTVGNDPCYRKIDNVVTVCGVIKPKSDITGSSTNHLILTLPDGYRPKRNCVFVCQGSNINRWTLTVATSGNVSFARYGTTEYVDCPTSAWLPFTAIFMVD